MFQDSLTKKIAEAASKIKTEYHEVEVNVNSVEGAVSKIMNEKLIGNQHKIDANKNNKIDAHDFKLLRAKKKVEEEAEQIDELKKSTLGSYVKKASKDLANSSFEHGEDEHRQYGDPEDTERENEMKKRERDIENRQKGISRAATKLSKEETELTESHFKVGDKVKCKESGMDGEITKLDKEDGGEDEKYYTFKREDGKVMKKAPNELSKINEEVDKKKKDLPFTPDATKKPVRNSDGTIQKPMSLARELAKRGLKKAMSKEEVELDENKKLEAIAKKQLAHIPGKLYKAADGAYYKNHKGKSHISNPAVGSKPSTPRSYSSSNDDDDAVAFQKRDRAGIKLSHDDFIGSGYGGGGGALSYDRKRNRVREEVEQIDELSKDTLKSYAGKVIDKTRTMPQGEKKQKHLVGLVKSMDKMKKEEFEEFIALSEEDQELYMEMLDSVETQLREIGLLDEEQLDEISTTAAKNYLHKALPSSSKLNQKSAKPGEEAAKKLNYSYDNAPYETKEFKKFSKRRTGIRKAIDKLASAHPENKKHATAARRAFDSIHNANYRVGMGEPNDNDRSNIRDAHKTVKSAVNAMHKNAMKEGVGLDEAMFPGTKEYEKKFGQSPQQKLKKKGDTVPTSQGDMTKTDKGVAHRRRFTEMIDSYAEGGLKYIATLVQEEPDNEEFTKEVDEVKRKATQKKSPEDEARVAKASVQAVKVEETEIQVINADIANGVEQIDIEEGARETAQRARELADKLRKKDPEKSKMYRNLGIKASQRSNNPTGVKAGQPYGMGNKALRKQGIEPVPSSMSSSKMRGYVEEVEIEEGAKETATRARELADKLSKKDPKKSQFYRNMANQALTRINKGVGIGSYRPGDIEGGGNKSLRRQGIEPAGKSPVFPFRKEEVELEERSLTEPEMKKKEEIVMSMKKKMPGFKERYGDRAKEVMYATATKMAKKD